MVKVTHLKIDSAMFGQIAARGGGNRAGVPGLVSLLQKSALLSFYGDAARRRAGRKERGCGQSVMSKKALEDRSAAPSRA